MSDGLLIKNQFNGIYAVIENRDCEAVAVVAFKSKISPPTAFAIIAARIDPKLLEASLGRSRPFSCSAN